MLVVKYYEWNCDRDVYELKVELCSEIYTHNDCTIICELENNKELISIHLDQLLSIKTSLIDSEKRKDV